MDYSFHLSKDEMKKQAEESNGQAVRPQTCPACATLNEPGTFQCKHCGRELHAAAGRMDYTNPLDQLRDALHFQSDLQAPHGTDDLHALYPYSILGNRKPQRMPSLPEDEHNRPGMRTAVPEALLFPLSYPGQFQARRKNIRVLAIAAGIAAIAGFCSVYFLPSPFQPGSAEPAISVRGSESAQVDAHPVPALIMQVDAAADEFSEVEERHTPAPAMPVDAAANDLTEKPPPGTMSDTRISEPSPNRQCGPATVALGLCSTQSK